MDGRNLLDGWLAAMPPVAAMQIRTLEGDTDATVLRLRAPLAANVNDKACAFGGSLASVMTLAGWGWLMLRLHAQGDAAGVYVADSQVRYLAPLYDDLLAEAWLADGQDWDGIARLFASRGRARATMSTRVLDASGVAVATMDARFALLRGGG